MNPQARNPRRLTPGEVKLGRRTIGAALETGAIRIFATPWPFTRAFVPGRWFGRDWIFWPRNNLPDDLSQAGLYHRAMLVHELVHVWQAQQGVNLLTGKLRAGDKPTSYEYPVGVNCDWDGLNIEQQAMVVEHRYRLTQGGRVPADTAFYDRVCPLVGILDGD